MNPLAMKVLESFGYPTEAFARRAWDEFAVPGAPVMDFVFTVCDSAAGEVCPVWPGQPMTAHWGIEDPAAVEGLGYPKRSRLRDRVQVTSTTVSPFSRPSRCEDRQLALGCKLRDIGRMEGATSAPAEGELMAAFDLPRRLTAEALGTALLVATVVGSGIMAEPDAMTWR